MEQKCLKTSVYANEVIFNETAEQPIDVDFSLPDYCPDISKIFKCRAVSRISAKGINGKNITIDGYVCITVLYADQDGNLCSYEYQYPFSKNLELSEECSGANLSCRSKCEYINCRAVTGRKIDIHGAAAIHVKVFRRRCTDIISDIDDANVEQRRGIAPATVPMGYSEKYLMVEEEIQLGQGQPPVQRILRYDARPCVKESKIINDKIVVKGEMSVMVLYCPENGGNAPQLIKTVIPFSQIIDMEGVNDSCECETNSSIAFLEIKPRTTDGDIKSLALTAKLLLCCRAFCGNDIAVLLDAFSRKYQAEITRNKICFEKIADNISETYHCKKNIDIEDQISSVLDIWCDMQSESVKFENGNMIITGTVIVGIIACDNDGNVSYYEKPIEFEYKYALKNNMDILECSPEIEVVSAGYTIIGPNNIEIRIDLGINAAIYEKRDIPLITDIVIDENKPAERSRKGAMTIYFSGDGECVWDIAKQYNASVDEIMKINELEEECLPEGKMILIPVM